MRVSYSNGDALVLSALPAQSPQAATLAEVLGGLHPHRTQSYSLSFSGTLEGTGTRWRASYRWQPEQSLSSVAPYDMNAAAPYLNLHLRQPIRLGRNGSVSVQAMVDLRNLLAQGYRPYLLSDGSLLLFAQDQRSLRAGLAFTF